jgi:hypothetical protein
VFCYQHIPWYANLVPRVSGYPEQLTNWPSLEFVRSFSEFRVYRDLGPFIQTQRAFMLKYAEHEDKLYVRSAIVLFAENTMLNKNLFNNEPSLLTKLCQCVNGKLGENEHFKPYLTVFNDLLVPGYFENRKLTSKRKYIEHIFSGSALGPLIGKYIADCYTE